MRRPDMFIGASSLVMVRFGEWRLLLWSAAYFFFLLFSYYLLRPVRETMGIARGADALPWLMTGTMIAMFLVSPFFAALVSRLPRRRFIPLTYRFFTLNLIIFWALLWLVPPSSREWLGYAFYIWVSVYNLFAVSIFWAIMSDLFRSDQGKRLFGLIGVGGTLGAICGSTVVRSFSQGFELWGTNFILAPHQFLLISAGLLLIAAACAGRLAAFPGMSEAAKAREPGPSPIEGIQLLLRSRYLLLIALFVTLFTILSTYIYLEQGRIIAAAAITPEERAARFASIDTWANMLTLSIQIFFTGRIMSRLGLAVALGLLPAITLAGFTMLWIAPSLTTLIVFQVLRRGLNHAVSRPAREVLYTIVSPDARYKSKSFIDTFVYRAGDMAGAWTPLLLLRPFSIPVALAGLIVSGISIIVAIALGRAYHRATLVTSSPSAPDRQPAPLTT